MQAGESQVECLTLFLASKAAPGFVAANCALSARAFRSGYWSRAGGWAFPKLNFCISIRRFGRKIWRRRGLTRARTGRKSADNPLNSAAMNTQRRRSCFFHIPILLAALVVMALMGAGAAEPAPKPIFPGITPVCSGQSLTHLALPNTTIESAVVDPANRMCLVTAVVTHPPAGPLVRGCSALPTPGIELMESLRPDVL